MGMTMRLTPIFLLVFSNVFMTYAWYGHLKDMRAAPLMVVIVLTDTGVKEAKPFER